MAGTLYRTGDLISHSPRYDNGISVKIYYKLIDIVDYNDNSFAEMNIITGRGDENSKVNLHLRPIVVSN